MSEGYVYILTNEAMPGLVKIGKTTRTPEERASQLYVTGVPQPFIVHAAFYSPNCDDLEQIAHEALSGFRISNAREFFRCDLGEAFNQVSGAHIEQVSVWVGDFAPGWELAHKRFMVNSTTIFPAAVEAGVDLDDAISALADIKADELLAIVSRWKKRHAEPDLVVVDGGAP